MGFDQSIGFNKLHHLLTVVGCIIIKQKQQYSKGRAADYNDSQVWELHELKAAYIIKAS